jgi:hypothetical protein
MSTFPSPDNNLLWEREKLRVYLCCREIKFREVATGVDASRPRPQQRCPNT